MTGKLDGELAELRRNLGETTERAVAILEDARAMTRAGARDQDVSSLQCLYASAHDCLRVLHSLSGRLSGLLAASAAMTAEAPPPPAAWRHS